MLMMQNDPDESVIQVSEEKLQKFGWILLGVAVLFTMIGVFVSPLDDQGKPVLLLPEVKAVEDYRRSAQSWISELVVLDGEIAHVIAADQQGDLFTHPDLPNRPCSTRWIWPSGWTAPGCLPLVWESMNRCFRQRLLIWRRHAAHCNGSARLKRKSGYGKPKAGRCPEDEIGIGGQPMAEISLEEFQRNQSVRISRDIIGQSEEHEQKMQTNWQKTWETAHQHLVKLLRFWTRIMMRPAKNPITPWISLAMTIWLT
jgi:hypothetical protein